MAGPPRPGGSDDPVGRTTRLGPRSSPDQVGRSLTWKFASGDRSRCALTVASRRLADGPFGRRWSAVAWWSAGPLCWRAGFVRVSQACALRGLKRWPGQKTPRAAGGRPGRPTGSSHGPGREARTARCHLARLGRSSWPYGPARDAKIGVWPKVGRRAAPWVIISSSSPLPPRVFCICCCMGQTYLPGMMSGM